MTLSILRALNVVSHAAQAKEAEQGKPQKMDHLADR